MSSQRSILIIDSDPNSRWALEQNVSAAGFPAQAFSSVEDFVFNAPLSAVGCVVADLTMTGLQGIDLKRLLQAAELDIPVIYLTACDTHESRAAACEVGAAGCFSKPVDTQKLLDTIKRVLRFSHRP